MKQDDQSMDELERLYQQLERNRAVRFFQKILLGITLALLVLTFILMMQIYYRNIV